MKTWILVADEGRARVFEAEHADGMLQEIHAFVHAQARQHGRDIASERLPRTQESMGSARHAIEPHTDLETIEAQRFAHELAEFLDQARKQQRFGRLLLLAAPRFLGTLRGILPEQVIKLVGGSIDKDVTHERAEEIRARLKSML